MSDDKPINLSHEVRDNLDKIISLYRRGRSYREIGAVLGIGKSTVHRAMKYARQVWRKRATRSYAAHLYEQLAKIDEVEAAAWNGWEKSQRDELITTQEDGEGALGPTSRTTIRRRMQAGDARFLSIVENCIHKRCTLLGLLDPDLREQSTIEGEVQVVSVVIDSREEAQQLKELDLAQFSRLVSRDPVPEESGI